MKALQFLFLLVAFTDCNDSINVKGLPSEIEAKVIGIQDGDTIEILFNGKPLRIRFAHVDCPEIKKSQPYGKAAKQYTSDMCFGKFVTVVNEGKFDRYHRLIGIVINNHHQNVNEELVKAGLAWQYKKYSKDSTYEKLENIARVNKVGLWADESPTPPWEWRR